MSVEAGAAGTTPSGGKKVNVWMIVAIVAIVVALVAGYLAYTARQEVDDWEAAASDTLAKLQAAGLELQDTVVSGVADYEDQVADLTTQLDQALTAAGVAESGQAETEQQLADAQTELEATQEELEATQQELGATQAALDDANAALAQVGEVVLADGTYTGPVLSARTEPSPAILFQEGAAWRVSGVAEDVYITAGGQELSLEEFSALLASTDPADVELVSGSYKVTVEDGLVTTIRKAQE